MELNQWLEKAKDYVPGTAAAPDTELNAAEVANLWNTYMQYSMLSQVLTYFAGAQAHNHDIHAVLTEAVGMTEKRAAKAAGILRQANIPAPVGFTAEDINPNAPGLYTDAFHLYYLRDLSRFGLAANLDNLFNSARFDVSDLYEESITSTIKFNRKVVNVMLSRGILPRHPYMPVSGARDLTRHPSFFRGFLGKKRPLLGQEINHLFASVQFNHFGRVLLTGFAQVTRSAQVRDYMLDGIKIADGIIQDFTATLREDGIPAPLPPGAGVTNTDAAPFSDKLMMYHVSILSASAGGIYAASLEASPRHDISAKYAQILARAALYADRGTRIMMQNGWLEEPPQAYKGEQAARERLH